MLLLSDLNRFNRFFAENDKLILDIRLDNISITLIVKDERVNGVTLALWSEYKDTDTKKITEDNKKEKVLKNTCAILAGFISDLKNEPNVKNINSISVSELTSNLDEMMKEIADQMTKNGKANAVIKKMFVH